MNFEEKVVDRIKKLEREVERLRVKESPAFGRPVFLTTPLTSTSWDGDTKNTLDRGIIDLSAVFGVPANIKAVLVRMSTTATTAGMAARLGVSATYPSALVVVTQVNGQLAEASGVVPCNSTGDIYYLNSTGYSGATTIEVWGYWL